MIKHFAALGAICTLLTATSSANAFDGAVRADNVVVSGSVTWTAVSGDTAAHSYVIGTNAEDYAGYSLRWWEDGDDPCKFRLYKRNFSSTDVNEPERNFCDGSPGNEKWSERRGADEYITAIQVCRNDKKKDSLKEKIKGVRLWGKVVDKSDVTLGPENGPDEDKHSHCKVWRNKVSCPAGQVATKIKVYYDTYRVYGVATDYGYARGISLGCRPISRS